MGEEVPKETETIAAKRAVRVAKKIHDARSRLHIKKSWWSNSFLEIAILVFVLILNIYTVFDRIGTDPMQTPFSGPTLPLLAKIVSFTGVDFLKSTQIVNVFFFLLFTPSLYFFVRSVTDRKLAAALSVLIASLPFYPFAGVRIISAMDAADSAHLASLAFIPIALLGLHRFLRHGKVKNLISASIFAAFVALTSPFGLLTYLIFAFILTFSEMLLGSGRLRISRLFSVLAVAVGLSSFWYNPSFLFWLITGPLGDDLRTTVSKLIPISFFSLPILAAFGYLLFDRKPNLQSVFLASFFTISFVIISSVGGGLFPSHPSRYAPEFGLSLSFLLSIVFVRITDYILSADLESSAIFGKLNKNIIRHKKKFAGSLIGVFVFFLITSILLGRKNILRDNDVLGVWTDVEKGEIWVAKDKFGGVSSVFGLMITGLSVGMLTVVSKKSNEI